MEHCDWPQTKIGLHAFESQTLPRTETTSNKNSNKLVYCTDQTTQRQHTETVETTQGRRYLLIVYIFYEYCEKPEQRQQAVSSSSSSSSMTREEVCRAQSSAGSGSAQAPGTAGEHPIAGACQVSATSGGKSKLNLVRGNPCRDGTAAAPTKSVRQVYQGDMPPEQSYLDLEMAIIYLPSSHPVPPAMSNIAYPNATVMWALQRWTFNFVLSQDSTAANVDVTVCVRRLMLFV